MKVCLLWNNQSDILSDQRLCIGDYDQTDLRVFCQQKEADPLLHFLQNHEEKTSAGV